MLETKYENVKIFWNDVIENEEKYIKKIKSLCSHCENLTINEKMELITFFGRCFSNIAWQKIVKVFSVKTLNYLFENENELMRRAVIPALRDDYDRVRTCFLYGVESYNWVEDLDWENRPTLTSEWRKKIYGEY